MTRAADKIIAIRHRNVEGIGRALQSNFDGHWVGIGGHWWALAGIACVVGFKDADAHN